LWCNRIEIGTSRLEVLIERNKKYVVTLFSSQYDNS
jgi:hypothetical protein